MDEPFTRIHDLIAYKVHYKPHGKRVALWDCPKVIRDAASGKPPESFPPSFREVWAMGWPLLLALGGGTGFVMGAMAAGVVQPQHTSWWAWRPFLPWVGALATLVAFTLMWWWQGPRDAKATYAREKALFDCYAANPELYRDEIYKEAVNCLPVLDLNGKHRSTRESKVGHLEAQVIEAFRQLGVQQETTVANRGKPFLIHQYELVGLKWGRWENGDTKNYTLDVAILWPERRIKFNLEVDGPSHQEAARVFKDARRDEVLTERGWFVRRFNHNFLNQKLAHEGLLPAAREVLSIVYFFAKYANNAPLDDETRIGMWLQERRFRQRQALARRVPWTEDGTAHDAGEVTTQG